MRGVGTAVSLPLATNMKTAYRDQGRRNIKRGGPRCFPTVGSSVSCSESDFLCQPQFPSSEEGKQGRLGNCLFQHRAMT